LGGQGLSTSGKEKKGKREERKKAKRGKKEGKKAGKGPFRLGLIFARDRLGDSFHVDRTPLLAVDDLGDVRGRKQSKRKRKGGGTQGRRGRRKRRSGEKELT